MSVRILTEDEQEQHDRVHGRFGDARAELWSRVYGSTYDATMSGLQCEWERHCEYERLRGAFDPHACKHEYSGRCAVDVAREAARVAADLAVANFDSHLNP